VSIKGTTHSLLREKARRDGIAMSQAVEREILAFLNKEEAISRPRDLTFALTPLNINKVVRR
jgi:hypothetical protein